MRSRPAESSGLAGAVALLIGYAAGIRDPEIIVAMSVVIAGLPAVVTGLVERFRRDDRAAVLEAGPRRR